MVCFVSFFGGDACSFRQIKFLVSPRRIALAWPFSQMKFFGLKRVEKNISRIKRQVFEFSRFLDGNKKAFKLVVKIP